MLRYLITATESMISASLLCGMLYAYLPKAYPRFGRLFSWIASLAGIVASAVMAYLKNKTKLIHTGNWNYGIFLSFLVVLVLFFVLDTAFSAKHLKQIAAFCAPLSASLLIFLMVFYVLPDILATPYTVMLGGEAFFSTGFLYRMIGLILGIILVILAAGAVFYLFGRAKLSFAKKVLKAALLIYGLYLVSRVMQTLYTRRVISGRTLFQIIRFTSNHAALFIYALLAVTLCMPLRLFVKSFFVKEPYENPAALRKIKASWRSTRRWAIVCALCFVMAVLNLTAVKAYANRPVELSAIEDCIREGETLVIPFEQVDDGHLHRFAYTTPEGNAVRFIIIRKPNSSAYGIGLDACDICGETGYYERSGQVVCNRCDVVMNINTIGFKGGCNPKLIDYEIADGRIIVPLTTLDTPENNKLFR